MDTLVIYIERIMCHNESNGYCLFSCSTDDKIPSDIPQSKFPKRLKRACVCSYTDVANFCDTFSKSYKYKVSGEWKNSKYGKQFNIKTIDRFVNKNKSEIVEYLKTIPGIGPAVANSIYCQFGNDSVDIINSNPEALLVIKGISKNKVAKIVDNLEETHTFNKIIDYFSKFSLSARKIKKIYDSFGIESIAITEENPFLLCSSNDSISFLDANSISLDNKVGLDSNQRITAAIKYVLQVMGTKSGDLYFPKPEILDNTLKILNNGSSILCNKEQILKAYKELLANGIIKEVTNNNNKSFVYPIGSYVCEAEVAKKIVDIVNNPQKKRLPNKVLLEDIDELENKYRFILADKQKEAVITSINNNISIITGGPGTGKTTVLKFILEIYKKHFSSNITLCAPTGRAARRMAESTGFPVASTIHCALGIQNDYSWAQSVGSVEPLNTDFIVIDESSMIDMELLYVLMNSINYNTKIVFIGDSEQLPSVGPGNCLREMIKSNTVPTTILDVIYRQQGEANKIVINSDKLKKQDFTFSLDDTFTFEQIKNLDKVQERLIELYLEEIKKPNKNLDNVQILTPFKTDKVPCSSIVINNIIQEKINPLDKYSLTCKVGKYGFRKGDKVIQQKNNDIAKNGDIGYITNIVHNDNELITTINFVDGEVANYTKADMEDSMMALAYAITVHKSQGSEYSTVIMPIIERHSFMLNRNLIYTAWTRAKENVFIVGNKRTLIKCGAICNIDNRKTLLSVRMKQRQKAYLKRTS